MWSSDFISVFFIKDKHIDAHSKKKKKRLWKLVLLGSKTVALVLIS